MGILPAAGNNPDEGVGAGFANIEQPVDRSGFFENIGAGYRAAQAGPGSTRSRQNAHEAELYDQVIAALTAEGELGADKISVRPGGVGYRGPKDIPVNAYGVGTIDKPRPFRNPFTARPSASQADNPLVRLYMGGDAEEREAIWQAVSRVRSRKPEFLKDIADEASLSRKAIERRNRVRAEAEGVTSRAGTIGQVGAFIGGMAGSLAAGDPENFVGAGMAGAAGKTVGRTIIRRSVQEGALNAAAGAVAVPAVTVDADRLGDEMTAGDVVRSVAEQGAIGVVFGAAAASAEPLAGKVKTGAGKAAEAVVDTIASVSPATRDAIMAAAMRAGTVRDREALSEFRRLHNPYGLSDTSTPEERAALNVVERDVEIREASPLAPESDAEHQGRLDAVAASLGVNLPPPRNPVPVQKPTGQTANVRQPTGYADAVHKAEGTGKNPDSSAVGHFQFIDSTWLEYAPRVANTSDMSRSQILALRNDRSIASRAEQMFRADNGRYLMARGVEDSPGNLSLAHFLGKVDAAKVLRARPDTPIAQVVSASSIRANRNVFKKIRTVRDMADWAHRRIGAAVDTPPARPDAVPEADYADELDYASVRPYGTEILRPDEVETDAGLMQYKSGGDATGVTDKLRDVTEWNPLISSEILVWEGLNGRRVVVDGHQRTGLAKRLFPQDDSIRIPSIVIREADGISAGQARVLGAMRNINLGTGSLLDNARVLRDAPSGAAMLKGAEKRREIEGLSRLSHEAFGAALNDVIDPEIAAQVGSIAADAPDTHMSLVDLLLKNRIGNPREAASIIRQARADGFGRPEAEQMSMFGDRPAESLYVPIARILAAAERRLRDEKRTFKTLSQKAGKIEGAGNRLDRKANEGKVVSSDEALTILAATAHRSGPVRDALIASARAELSGAGRANAVEGFLDALAGIDLRAAASGVGRDGRAGEPSGEAGSGDAISSPDAELPDSLEPSLFEQAVDIARRGEAFSDPVGEGAKTQTALIEHDLAMDAVVGVPPIDPQMLSAIMGGEAINPAIMARRQQEAMLQANAPLRPGDIDPEGVMGLGLFDVADQPRFQLETEGEPRTLPDLMAEAEADEIAAANARACLMPGEIE
jgi:hypothetical protein